MINEIELKVYDKTFSFHKDDMGEWEPMQPITGPTMTPIFAAALDRIASLESVMEAVDIIAEMESTGEESEEEMYLIGCHNRHRQKYPKGKE